MLSFLIAIPIALIPITLTYLYNRALEPYKSAVNLAARQKEITFSRLYEKELESYEILCIALSSFIDSVLALTSPLKFVRQSVPGNISNDDLLRLNQELSVEVGKTLADFYTKLEARRLYLPQTTYQDVVKLRNHLRQLATEYMIHTEYPNPDRKEGIRMLSVFEEKTVEARRLRDDLIERFQELLRERVSPIQHTTVLAFTRRPPFIRLLSIPVERIWMPQNVEV